MSTPAPDRLVGLMVDEGPDVLVGMLGILQAGQAFVPLDPRYPEARLELLAEDCALGVLVTERLHLERALELAARVEGVRHVICLDPVRDGGEAPPGVTLHELGAGGAPAGAAAAARTEEPQPEEPAYVIFTSGSTGTPKGVPISHANLSPTLDWADDRFGFDEDTRVLQTLSYSFDFGVFELLTTVLAGGTLHFVDRQERADPELYSGHVRDRRINTVHCTPSFIGEMAAAGVRLDGLEILHMGGEALTRGHVERLGRAVPAGCRLFNGYGPTEATINTTIFEIGAAAAGERIPIGRPTAHHAVWVLDRHLRQVPAGVPGELLVGGEGLSRGYFRRPRLAAEKFVPDPLGGAAGGRLYKTGDRVRFLADGDLEFLGRFDHQVKLRGFRVELGEIEAALRAHDAVAEAVALVRERSPGDQRLAAYLVAAPGAAAPGEDALRSFLRGRLPAHMVPQAFVTLEAMPIGTTGKIDLKALPAPDWHAARAVDEAPRTPLEKRLAAIWAEVLDVPRVGRRDSFFELGGHSLIATRLVARVRRDLGVDVPLRQLFETPTVAGLARALPQAADAVEGIRAGERGDGPPPLSFAQERLWILDRLEPGNTAYNIPGAVLLRGRLDRASLERAFGAVLERHEVLRTVYRAGADGTPRQVVLPAAEAAAPLAFVDLSALDPQERRRELDARLAREMETPFDLVHGPVLRVGLLRLAGDEHALLLTVHHVAADGWSLSVLVREVVTLYHAYAEGRPAPLPPLEIQYADFAVWQRRHLTGAVLERQLAYWRRQLADLPAGLELPTDRPRPAVRSFRGEHLERPLDAATTAGLEALARQAGASLFMVLLAGFKLLLSRLAGTPDVAVGTPIAGRQRTEAEDLIGMFLNTLVLRGDLSGSPTFAELVARVREVALGAFAHQDLPFERLLDELQPERDLSRTPLFQVFFNMLNLPPVEMRMPGLAVEPLVTPDPLSKFDLTLYVRQDGDRPLRFDLVYNADLFGAERVALLLEQYFSLLRQAVAAPETPIDRLTLTLPETAARLPDPRQPLDAAWHGAVHDLFFAAAAADGDRQAVVDPRGAWTYREVAAASHRVAHRLREAGLERGRPVVIYGYRGAPLVWAVLGTLEAGGAFVILDPTYPPERLAGIARQASPGAWITIAAAGAPPAELAAAFAELGCPRLDLGDGVEGSLAGAPASPLGLELGPDDLAYVAFTSGSTGQPKGVLGRHGPLSHFLPFQRQRFDLRAGDRYSMLSGLAHDPLHRDLFTPLALGGTIVIPDPARIFTPGHLAAWMARERVSVAHLTPAMGQVLAVGAPGEEVTEVPTLRYVFLVGDVLSRRDVERLRRLAPAVTCVNLYGSTETQRAVGFYESPPGEGAGADGKQILPLGRGMRDVQLLVLNAAGALAGVGELGELCIRSPHLAAGYLGDPELTAARFQRNPLAGPDADPEDRLYRTGDLGRYGPDGNAVFVGRADQQVKIRGFRIELGEIEAHLGRMGDVKEAVVLAIASDGALDRQLVACVVPVDGAAPNVPHWRDKLKEVLPSYMVPAGFMVLEALPLTPNRKVDRSALIRRAASELRRSHQEMDMAQKEPHTEMETLIAGILKEVLEIDAVGVEDNFFDLGANSLLLVRVHSKLQEAIGREIMPVEIFSHPSVSELAAHLTGGSEAAAEPPAAQDRSEELKKGRNRLRQRASQRRRVTAR